MKALQTIMLSCAKASEYGNLRDEGQLSVKQNVQLNLHLLICKTCRAYTKQGDILKKMFNAYAEKTAEKTDNKGFKDALKSKVEKLES